MIDEKQKKIYNSFLRASRIAKNKPFRPRQNFENLSNTDILQLKKLDSFFLNHSSVGYHDFFTAPYSVYTDTDYFDLKFYTTLKAIKCYTEHIKQLEYSSTDSDVTIDRCKSCCVNIYNFCKANKITLQEYKEHMNGAIPQYIQHLKDHKINFYILHGLDITLPPAQEYAAIFKLMFNDFYTVYNTTRSKFIRSERLKNVVRTALRIIDEKLLIYKK